MPQVIHNGRRLETRRIKANGNDKLEQYKCKLCTTNRFGSNIMLWLQTWIINVQLKMWRREVRKLCLMKKVS